MRRVAYGFVGTEVYDVETAQLVGHVNAQGRFVPSRGIAITEESVAYAARSCQLRGITLAAPVLLLASTSEHVATDDDLVS